LKRNPRLFSKAKVIQAPSQLNSDRKEIAEMKIFEDIAELFCAAILISPK